MTWTAESHYLEGGGGSRSRSSLVSGVMLVVVVVVMVVTPGTVPGLGNVLSTRSHEGVEIVEWSAVADHGALVGRGEAEVRPLQVVTGHRVLPRVLRHLRHYLGVEGDGEGGAHSILVGVLVGGLAQLDTLVRDGRTDED